jgi:hypothetical protein
MFVGCMDGSIEEERPEACNWGFVYGAVLHPGARRRHTHTGNFFSRPHICNSPS